MPRVFACLAVGVVIVMLLAGGYGLLAGTASPDRHVLLAVVSLIQSCFVQVLAFTYFTVTGKMMQQAVSLGRLDAAVVHEAKRLKRGFTRRLAAVVASLVVVSATGGAHWGRGASTAIHVTAASLALMVQVMVFAGQYGLIVRNAGLFGQTMTEYETRRSERRPRGLQTEV